jgi:hypothetical protein
MNIGWGNDHGSKYRLRGQVPGRQDRILFSGAPNLIVTLSPPGQSGKKVIVTFNHTIQKIGKSPLLPFREERLPAEELTNLLPFTLWSIF